MEDGQKLGSSRESDQEVDPCGGPLLRISSEDGEVYLTIAIL